MNEDLALIDLIGKIGKISDELIALLELEEFGELEIDDLTNYLDKRDFLIDEIKEFSIDDKAHEYLQLIKDIGEKDELINQLMTDKMAVIKELIKKNRDEQLLTAKKKTVNRSYLNSQVQNDGYFIDSKK